MQNKKYQKQALRTLSIFLLVLLLSVVGATQDRRPDRGIAPANSYSVSDIEKVNLTNGNLMLNIPLASVPSGRGTTPGYTVALSYNSKLWDAQQELRTDGIGQDPEDLYYTREVVKAFDGGGWRLDSGSYRLIRVNRLEYEASAPCMEYSGAAAYARNGYSFKMELALPDGSVRVLHQTVGSEATGYPNGFYNVDPYGVQHSYSYTPPQQSGNPPSCSSSTTQATTAGINYFTTDGSRMRLFLPYQPGVGYQSMSWTLNMPDGRTIENKPTDDTSINQRITDRNGNKLVWKPATMSGESGVKIENEVGHYVFVGSTKVIQPGVAGELVETTLDWGNVWAYQHYHTTNAANANTSYIYADLFQAVGTLDKITLPEQAGGGEYVFTYHGDTTEPGTGNYTDGTGELKSVSLPSGAVAEYSYSLNGSLDDIGNLAISGTKVTGRELTYDLEYDGSTTETTESTSYTTAPSIGGTCAPDGGCTTEYSAVGGDLNGYAYRVTRTGGNVVEKIWVAKRHMGGSYYQKVEPFVKTEFTTVADANGNPVLTAIKDYEYDQNGNLLEVKEYDWVAYSSVPRSSTPDAGEYLPVARPTGLPTSGLTLKRKTVNAYYNATPNILAAESNHANHYANPSSPKLHNVIKSTEVRDGSNVVKSRQEFIYDDASNTGNLIETRVWDSTKGAVSDPLTSGNWIKTSATYDSYGNVLTTTDANNTETHITYGNVAGPSGNVTDLYPTQTIVAYGTPLARTTTAVYDFYTGRVTSTTDEDNDLTNATEYDDLGRPTKAITAYGDTTHESWTVTEYHDDDRFVVVRSDLEEKEDGKKVAIQHYDQLGRVRLSRTLEDASTEDPTDETDGIKVQTRYLTTYSSPNGYNYQLTSNPYRASTSSGASGEDTMGWTRSKAHHLGKHSEVETFSGSALPAPWGSNSSTTGMVQTDIDANATTVTDQAGKLRRSITNALGQLTRVDEPNSSNVLGSVSSPNQDTGYTYDVLGNLLTVTQGSQTRTFTYSSLSRLLTAANPESGTITYTYDNGGNLATKVDARSITTSYTYDALNRVTLRNYSDSTPDVDYTYGTTAPKIGKLTKVNSSVSTTEYTGFDILGRVTAHKQTTDGNDYTTAYAYNLSGALIEETYPSGRVVKNVLDRNGELEIVQSKKNSSAGYWNYAENFNYNPAGAMTSMQLGNGHWESTTFNSRLQPTQIALGTTGTSTLAHDLLKLNYTYGTTANNGNVLTQTIKVLTVGANTGFEAVQTYTYDSLNRINDAVESVTPTNGSASQSWKQTFTYDRYGNRRFDEGNTSMPASFSNPAVSNPTISTTTNRLTSSGYTYDNAGNTTADAGGQSYTYDAENKMVSASNGGGTIGQYYYDGDGKRVKKVVPGTGETTVFVYDAAGKQVAEYSTIVETTNAQVAYLTNDHLGSARINTDQNGAVITRHDYHPFGEEIDGTGGRTTGLKYGDDSVRKQFTGYERDGETGLDYAKARMYSKSLGRFTTTDPSRKSIALMSPQTWNRYTYCYNNPLTLVDENGKWPTGRHSSIIDKAFSAMHNYFKDSVKSGSARTDMPGTVLERNAPKHAMTRASDVQKYGLEKATDIAKNEARDFINTNLAKAKELAGEAAKFERGSEKWEAKMKESFTYFGAAAHTIMDNVSPAHTGFQVFTGYSTTAINGAGAGAPLGLVGALTTAVIAVGSDIAKHDETEDRPPNDAETNVMNDRLRYAFRDVYGEQAYTEAIEEKDRKETERRTGGSNPGVGF